VGWVLTKEAVPI